MSDPVHKDKPPADDFAGLTAIFKEWLGVIGTVGGAVAALLAVLLPGQTTAVVQVIGYTVALMLLCVGGFIFVRVRRRQHSRRLREKRRETWEREMAEAHLTAFRGLFPYQESDELPGEHRQLEARRLVTQFSEPTFSFGVVCGDSGCGKTSLLRSAIQRRLKTAGEEKGFSVLYLSNPRELAEDGASHGERADIAGRLRREIETLRRLAGGASQGNPLILIIDQFEEFFIEYSRPELRLELGRFLNGLIKSSPPVRILCAIRRDYLADMKDLAPPPDSEEGRSFFAPISLQSLFTLKNFTVEQAASVIRECAERDRIELDEEFAATLASDLGAGGFVRPPELQIVCTALAGNMTTAEYRLAGGARGILSHYIEDAIEVSGDPNTGRRVLRALCDFPAHAKRNPQTAADITEAVGVEGPQASASVRAALRQFEVARLAVSEKRGEAEPTYALVHDYLVDAVSKATSDVSTRDEEANQMLEYYVSEYRTDPKTRIPYRRLRFVRKYADPKKLSDPTAHRLLRASFTRLATSTAALAALVAVTTTVLVAIGTTRRVWRQELVSYTWEKGDTMSSSITPLPDWGFVLTQPDARRGDEGSYVKLWDIKTGKLAYMFKGLAVQYISREFILYASEDGQAINAFHIPTRKGFTTTLPAALMTAGPWGQLNVYGVSNSGMLILVGKQSGNLLQGQYQVFSLADNRPLGEIKLCQRGLDSSYLTNSGEYIVAPCMIHNKAETATTSEGTVEPTIINVRANRVMSLKRIGYTSLNYAVDENNFLVVTLERASSGQYNIAKWDLRTGTMLGESDVPLLPEKNEDITYGSPNLLLSPRGNYVVVGTYRDWSKVGEAEQSDVIVLRTSDLRRVITTPETGVRIYYGKITYEPETKRVRFIAWPHEEGGAFLWDLTQDEPKLISAFTLPKRSYIYQNQLAVNPTADKAIILPEGESEFELWDIKNARKLRSLDAWGLVASAGFTLDGNAVRLLLAGGVVSLSSADNGERITDIRDVGGTQREVYYDPACRTAHIWTDEGRILLYTEGWDILGQERWFWPAEKCG